MGAENLYYTYKDFQGTIMSLTDQAGTVVYEQNFDAWGKERNYPTTVMPTAFDWLRGYTEHEHLTQYDLINMNGRLYDPSLGRMLSPDNFVQSPTSTQSHNRYSYVFNNPLKYTDPSGQIAAPSSAVQGTSSVGLSSMGRSYYYIDGLKVSSSLGESYYNNVKYSLGGGSISKETSYNTITIGYDSETGQMVKFNGRYNRYYLEQRLGQKLSYERPPRIKIQITLKIDIQGNKSSKLIKAVQKPLKEKINSLVISSESTLLSDASQGYEELVENLLKSGYETFGGEDSDGNYRLVKFGGFMSEIRGEDGALIKRNITITKSGSKFEKRYTLDPVRIPSGISNDAVILSTPMSFIKVRLNVNQKPIKIFISLDELRYL